MTFRVGNVVIIEPEPDDVCEVCSKIEELRPYGPGGTRICFGCAMGTPEMRKVTTKNMNRALFGDEK